MSSGARLHQVKRLNLFDPLAEVVEREEDKLLENMIIRVRIRSQLAQQKLMGELETMLAGTVSSVK
jgi:hypothetical protein